MIPSGNFTYNKLTGERTAQITGKRMTKFGGKVHEIYLSK